MDSLNILRTTAAEIAAAAVYELYSDIRLLGGGATEVGFSYEFIFPHPLHPHIIEEKMRQIVQERRPIRTLEMVPFSASELLKSQGHYAQADAIEDEGLVEIIKIGDFHDLSKGPHLKNTFELAAFKITAEALGDKRMRIKGWCHHSKNELKQFLKQLDAYIEPQKIGESMGLWSGSIWFPKGLALRQKLIYFLKKEWFVDAFEIQGPFTEDHYELHKHQGQKKVAEEWSLGHRETFLQVTFFDKMISPLHLIGKTLTILGFDHSLSSEGFVVVDGIGRSQLLVQVERKGTIIAHVERILDQMLEKNLWVMLEN